MIVDDVTVRDRSTTDAPPGPRTAGPAVEGLAVESGASPGSRRSARRSRPPSEYWDVETARWTTRSPIPTPRPA
jgi:hypothetical protein